MAQTCLSGLYKSLTPFSHRTFYRQKTKRTLKNNIIFINGKKLHHKDLNFHDKPIESKTTIG